MSLAGVACPPLCPAWRDGPRGWQGGQPQARPRELGGLEGLGSGAEGRVLAGYAYLSGCRQPHGGAGADGGPVALPEHRTVCAHQPGHCTWRDVRGLEPARSVSTLIPREPGTVALSCPPQALVLLCQLIWFRPPALLPPAPPSVPACSGEQGDESGQHP